MNRVPGSTRGALRGLLGQGPGSRVAAEETQRAAVGARRSGLVHHCQANGGCSKSSTRVGRSAGRPRRIGRAVPPSGRGRSHRGWATGSPGAPGLRGDEPRRAHQVGERHEETLCDLGRVGDQRRIVVAPADHRRDDVARSRPEVIEDAHDVGLLHTDTDLSCSSRSAASTADSPSSSRPREARIGRGDCAS